MMRSTVLLVAGSSAVSAGVGILAGYIYAERRLMTVYDERLKVELEESRKFYTRMTKTEEYENPSEVLANVDAVIVEEEYRPTTPPVVIDEDVPQRTEYRVSKKPKVPPLTEAKARVVSFDEFVENPKDYDQRTITYYEQDDVLADERDVPIDDIDAVIGLSSLEHFGQGSRDSNIVYVRNDRLAMDLEVVRDPGSYEASVTGSIKHSHERRGPMRFRIDDD